MDKERRYSGPANVKELVILFSPRDLSHSDRPHQLDD